MATKEQDHAYWLERKKRMGQNQAIHKEQFEHFARKTKSKLKKTLQNLDYGDCMIGGCDTAGDMPCYRCKYWQKFK